VLAMRSVGNSGIRAEYRRKERRIGVILGLRDYVAADGAVCARSVGKNVVVGEAGEVEPGADG